MKNKIIEVIIYVLFFISTINLLFTKKIYAYLHYKMELFIYIQIFILLLFIVYNLKNLFKVSDNKINKKLFLIFLPIICMNLNTHFIGSNAIKNKNLNFSNSIKEININKESDIDYKEKFKEKDLNVDKDSDIDKKEILFDNKDNNAELSDLENFSIVNEIPQNPGNINKIYDSNIFLNTILDINNSEEEGLEFEIVGFVLNDTSLSENNKFQLGRLLITCCIADAQFVGVVIESDEKYRDDQWLKIKGKIYKKDIYNPYEEKEIPVMVLKAENIEKISPAENPYVYFQ